MREARPYLGARGMDGPTTTGIAIIDCRAETVAKVWTIQGEGNTRRTQEDRAGGPSEGRGNLAFVPSRIVV